MFQYETYSLDDEVTRIEEELAELDDVLDELSEDHSKYDGLAQRRQDLEAELAGVKWARGDEEMVNTPDWDIEAMTLGGLTGGQVAGIQDSLPEDAGQGAVRIYFTAHGTPVASEQDDPRVVEAEAPYVDEDQSMDDRISAVSQLPLQFQRWAHARVDSLTGVAGNAKPDYDALLAENTPETSTSTSTSST